MTNEENKKLTPQDLKIGDIQELIRKYINLVELIDDIENNRQIFHTKIEQMFMVQREQLDILKKDLKDLLHRQKFELYNKIQTFDFTTELYNKIQKL
jgi:hypothetical protein